MSSNGKSSPTKVFPADNIEIRWWCHCMYSVWHVSCGGPNHQWGNCSTTRVAATISQIINMLKGSGCLGSSWPIMLLSGYRLYYKALVLQGRNKSGVAFNILNKPLKLNFSTCTTNSTMNCVSPSHYMLCTLINNSLNQKKAIEYHWQTNNDIIQGLLTMDYIWWTPIHEQLAYITKITINMVLSISAFSVCLPSLWHHLHSSLVL
jgi:hypothetical protein